MRIAGHVDEQIAEQPIDQPGRALSARRRQLAKGDLELIQRVIPRFVHARRLRRRADEQAGEQIRQRGVIVPIRQKAPQQVGTAQERRIRRSRAAQDKVIATACACVAPIEHEFLGGQM